jgi:type I restriction enzyme S subunit
MKFRYREPHEMKDSGVEWLGMIPKEWEVIKIPHCIIKCNQAKNKNAS